MGSSAGKLSYSNFITSLMQSPFFSPTHDFLNYAVLTSKINVLVIQTNYLIIPSHTFVWVCNGKQSCFVFCGNLIREECWKHGAGWEWTLPCSTSCSCASGMWQQPPSSTGAGWKVASWIWGPACWPLGLTRAAFMCVFLAAGGRWSPHYPFASHKKWLGCTWMEGLPGLQSLASFCLPCGSKTLDSVQQ